MWNILLGHILGDYFFQTKHMALNKLENPWVCCVHCLCYTLLLFCVCSPLMHNQTLLASIGLILLIFVSHFIVDFFSVGQIWLVIIKGRSFLETKDEYDLVFTAIVSVVVDNTIHICCVALYLKQIGAI